VLPAARRDKDEQITLRATDSYSLEFESMSDAIRRSAAPLLGREDALGQARAIEALCRSGEAGGPVDRS
jgi:xylose dehydrogenase (NAD/NADP)